MQQLWPPKSIQFNKDLLSVNFISLTLLNLSWNTNLNNKRYSPSEYYPKQRLENYETETFYISLSLKVPFFLIPYLTPDFTMFN